MNNLNIKIYIIGKEKYESYWLDDKPLDSLSYFDLCKKYKKVMKGEDISSSITDRSLLLQQFKSILKNEIMKRYSKKDNNNSSYHHNNSNSNNNSIIVTCNCPLCQEDDPKLTTILSKNSPSWLDRLKLVFNFFNKYFQLYNNNNNSNNNSGNNNNKDQKFSIYLHNSILFSFIYTHRRFLNIDNNSTDSEIKRFVTDSVSWHPRHFQSGKDDHRLNGCKGYWKMCIQPKDDFNSIYTFSNGITLTGGNGNSFIKFLLDSPILLINKTTKQLNYQRSTKKNKLLLSNSDEEEAYSDSSDMDPNHQSPNVQNGNNKIWGTDISSILYQMSLLQSWGSLLDSLSIESKELIWNTCCYFVNFDNFDKDSFSKTLYIWGNDLFSNLFLINILFSAIGYLKEMDEIEGDFYYIDSDVKVFNEFIFTDEYHSSGSEDHHASFGSDTDNYGNIESSSGNSSRNHSPVSFDRINESNETSNSISFDKLSIRSTSPSTSPTMTTLNTLIKNNPNLKIDNLQLISKPNDKGFNLALNNNNEVINSSGINKNGSNSNNKQEIYSTSTSSSTFKLNNTPIPAKISIPSNSAIIFNMIEKNKQLQNVNDQKEKQLRINQLVEDNKNQEQEPSQSLAYLSSLLSLSTLSNYVNENKDFNNIISQNNNNSNGNSINNNNNNNGNINNSEINKPEKKVFVNSIKNLLNSSSGSVNFHETNNNFLKSCSGCNKRHYSEIECNDAEYKSNQRICKKILF